jgi:hypothetical protein
MNIALFLLAVQTVTLPTGDVFPALLADPKEPESVAGIARVRSAIRNTTVGAAAFGVNIGLVRWNTKANGDGIQLGIAGGVFAQFDLERSSIDLLNADYIIGLPLTYRRGVSAVRVRLFHQSSHLGDEFLLQEPVPRINLSFEALELIVSQHIGVIRLYGGGEIVFRHEPSDLGLAVLHGGIEYRQRAPLFRLGTLGEARVVAGLDLRSPEHDDWTPGRSFRGGLDFSASSTGRRWSVLLAAHNGPSPYGQFYHDWVRYIGIGLHFPL